MADKRDFYEVLGIEKGADDATIKKAYRTLAKKYHPDMNQGDADAEHKFKEVNEAYGVLSDQQKKEQYDQFGHSAFDQSSGGGYGGFGGGGFGDFTDLGDIFGSFFGGGFGGSNSRTRNSAVRGEDILVRLTINFEEAVFGTKKDISYSRTEKCGECGGSGAQKGTQAETCGTCGGSGQRKVIQRLGGMQFQSTTTCETCGGTGKIIKTPCTKCRGGGAVKNTKKIGVTIPAGINNGERVALRGLGNDGKGGGISGDLIIAVTVRPHNIFRREGFNIYCEVPISITEATLGAEITVPSLEGSVKHTIPEGTQTGTSFTLRQKGIPYVNSANRRGDLIFTVTVEVPKALTEKQKQHMRDFAESCGESNYLKQSSFFKKMFDKNTRKD